MNRYIVFFCEDNQKYGVVRSDAAMYSERGDAEDRADYMNIKSTAASSLGSSKSEQKAKASRENGKKGGRPRKCPDCGGYGGHYDNCSFKEETK